jgi:hypothetical protein
VKVNVSQGGSVKVILSLGFTMPVLVARNELGA